MLPYRDECPGQRKPKEHLLCAIEIPQTKGNVGEPAHLPLTHRLPAAPQERGRQLLHLAAGLLTETEHL